MNKPAFRAPVRVLRRALPLVLLTASFAVPAAADWRPTSVEFNPVRAMLSATDLATTEGEKRREASLTGGVHFGNDGGRAEIAVPIGWLDIDDGRYDHDYSQFEFDVQYRMFLTGADRSGLYLGPLLHFSHTDGVGFDGLGDRRSVSTDRVGLGVVVGFRKSLREGYYWGMAFSSGKFVAGARGADINDYFADVMTSGESAGPGFVDIELLKFGKRF